MKKVIISILFSVTLLWSWGNNQITYNSYATQIQYGIEINPFRLIVMSDSWRSVSATFSIFDYKNNSEFAFPILYSSENESTNNDGYNDRFKIFTIDLHYRKFLYNRVGGLYVSGVARVVKLDGRLKESKIGNNGENYASVTKIGVGLGVGYRLLPQSSKWYWGFGLIAGRYLESDNNIFYSDSFSSIFDDSAVFIDIELLKIGYKF